MSTRESRYDLTQGPILQKLLLVALPIMGSQLLQMSYNLADMFWLGRLSNEAVAASGTAGMYMWLSAAFLLIGRMGAEIGVSQSLGCGEEGEAKKYAQNAIFLAGLLGTFYALVLIFLRVPLVGFFNIQEAHVAQQTEAYLATVAISMPFNFIASSLVGIYNASGNSRTPFWTTAVGLALNIVLDPLMIFTMELGIVGAALATVLSQVVSCLLMVLAIKRGKTRPFAKIKLLVRPAAVYIRQILRWSVPIAIESALFTFLSMINSRLIASFGTPAMTVGRVGSQIESLTWLVGGGYGSALTAYIGQNFGAGKWSRIHKGTNISFVAMAIYGAMVTTLVFFGGGFLFRLFLPDPELTGMGITYLRILAVCQIPQCIEAVAGSTFKGTGRTVPPTIVSVTSNALRVVLAYILADIMGLNGIWVAISAGAVLRGIWSFVWYMSAARKMPREDAPNTYCETA